MAIKIVSVGKKHESWVAEGVKRYEKRLRKPFDVEWDLVPHSAREGLVARQEESERIQKRLGDDDFVLLLDERGEVLDSPALSRLFTGGFDSRGRITIVIGGAYGVNDELRERADKTISLSSLVFPHQLVRLILAEQIYRSQEIAAGRSYHHE